MKRSVVPFLFALVLAAVWLVTTPSRIAAAADGAPALAPQYTDHAVLQRGQPITLAGTAVPSIALDIGLGGQQVRALADASGRWQAKLPGMPAGGPVEITVRDAAGRSVAAQDIYIGDVWLCSGQSNMEMQVRRVANLETEVANGSNANIRLLQIGRHSADAPRRDFEIAPSWQAATPATVRDFSAACFFFGRDIEHTQRVSVGLVDDSWGGSSIQAWMSPGTLHALGGYDVPLQLLARHERDAAGAEADWQAVVDKWWQGRPASAIGLPQFSDPQFDDSGWSTMRVNGDWEDAGIPALANFDGVVWLRSTVQLSAAQAALGAHLLLGAVDDADTTWVNGRKVGGFEGWDVPRDYTLPPGVLHAGSNLIAVRVLDTGGGGGMWSPPAARQLAFADGSSVQLALNWRYDIAGDLAAVGALPHAPWLPAIGTTTLYNGMIAPLGPMGLRGMLWYQGEANVADAGEYARLLPALMADWRAQFGADLPFYIVQLAGYGYAESSPVESGWAALRDVQRRVAENDAHSGLAAAIDIGDRYDIHPTNKQEVGRRLALLARHRVYGEALEDSGPAARRAQRRGASIVISFAHADGGLRVLASNRPAGFELCSAPRHCRFADARVERDSVVLDERGGERALRVRYGWAGSPVANLVNAAGLPASPFELAILK